MVRVYIRARDHTRMKVCSTVGVYTRVRVCNRVRVYITVRV